jgi:hypothetical protein
MLPKLPKQPQGSSGDRAADITSDDDIRLAEVAGVRVLSLTNGAWRVRNRGGS